VLVASGAAKLREVEEEARKINPAVKVLAIPTDITQEDAVNKLFEKVRAEFGHADILISNAAYLGGQGNIHEADIDAWWKNYVGDANLNVPLCPEASLLMSELPASRKST
jgi:NAD(P)-dependent dehydrogenase (short-subunit alcohol dehydrogenase family)